MPAFATRRHPHALAALLILVLACGTASAQRYGQNPGLKGVFVPLADGPVPADTTGASADGSTNAGVSTGAGSLALGNGMQLSLSNGQLSFTADPDLNPGLFNLISAFGEVDISFETMLGNQVRIFSTITPDLATVTINFGNAFLSPGPTDPNANPNANPIDDPSGGIDGSPGNPIGDT